MRRHDGPFDAVIDKLLSGEPVEIIGLPQFPRTDGSFDPQVVAVNQLVADWLEANPHPLIEWGL